jgi:tetratricopeptide repeat protein 30
LLEVLAKHMILFKDQSMEELVQFLDDCEASGKNVSTITDSLIGEVEEKSFKQTVAYEARRLKSLFLQLYE